MRDDVARKAARRARAQARQRLRAQAPAAPSGRSYSGVLRKVARRLRGGA
jgi:hypothetical protein